MDVEERINDLQSRLAFQDDTIQALNDALVTQQEYRQMPTPRRLTTTQIPLVVTRNATQIRARQ